MYCAVDKQFPYSQFTMTGCGAGLDFYQRVKAVNYLRRQAHLLRCGFCDGVFDTKDCLTLHIESELHARLPDDTTLWDQPQFFFPTFENDPLLTALEDFNEMGENSQEAAAHVDEKD
jgi:hypothetical protein